jgi:hypothetical protein
VFRWVNGRNPRQYGLDFGLWTRAAIAELIRKKFGIGLGPCRLIEQQIDYYQHDGRHTQDPTQHIFSHDRRSVRLMSSPIRVASAVVAGARWQSGKRSIEGHYHSIENM